MSIKDRSNVKEDGSAEFGMTPPSDGWHVFKFNVPNIQITKSDYGESILVPFAVDDENDPDNGLSFSYFISMEGEDAKRVAKAEGRLCTLLVQTGIAELVDQRLKNPVSLFTPETRGVLVEMMNALLLDRHIKLNVVTTNKGKTLFNESQSTEDITEAKTNEKTEKSFDKAAAPTFG